VERQVIDICDFRIKAGMDDDMKATNLETDPDLESKMKFYYSPYNAKKEQRLFMKFGSFSHQQNTSMVKNNF